MANTIGWGQGSANNTNQWGRGATNNSISWGSIYNLSPSGETNIIGGLQPTFELKYDLITTDFTFTRASFATRVNEFGLIETVTDLGSDLIQNGDFEELGSELVTNGDFENGTTDWTIEAVWTIQDGYASGNGANGSSQELTQSNVTTIGKKYKVTYDILNYVSGSVVVGSGDLQSGNGTITEYWEAVQTTLKIRGNAFFNGDITNISVKQVDPNDEWSLGSDWVIQDNKLTYGGNTDIDFTKQSGALTNNSVGKEYIINFEILDSAFTIGFTSGSGFFDDENGDNIKSEFSVGVHTIKAVSTNSFTDFRIYGYTDSGNGGSIDNISIQEVLEDDVPRIDYTGSTFDVPILGSELITSGNETADVVSIADNQNVLIQTSIVTIGKTYQIDFEIYDYVEGSIFLLRPNDLGVGSAVSANGTYTYTVVADASTSLIFRTDGVSTTLKLRGISVKEVTAYTTTDKGAFLLEPISTNFIDYSENFSDSSWLKVGSPTITPNYGTSPDGTQNSTRIQGSSSSVVSTNAMTGAASGETRSIYVRATSGSGNIQLTSHNTNTNNIFSINETWQRVQTNSLTSTSGQTYFYIDMRGASTNIYDIEVWGAQGEELSYATSYIPCLSGTTVTRAQETCVDATPTINSEEGVLYAEISTFDDANNYEMIEINDGTSNNRITVFFYGSALYGYIKENNVTKFQQFSTVADVTDFHKVALKWKQDDVALWVDGVEAATLGAFDTFSEGLMNKLSFVGAGTQYFYGNTKDLRIYDKALTDEQLTELTTI